MADMKRKRALIWGGLLLIGAALCISVWSMMDEQRAAQSAQQALEHLTAAKAPAQTPSDANAGPLEPVHEMPTTNVNGVEYLGTLEIPVLGLELPIISQWSDSLLKIAPCRYKGSVYLGDLILAGHNYRAHFSKLNQLQIGDTVIFTDAEGAAFSYEVSALEQLPETAVDEMESGEWDLTLFTCTVEGSDRFTVRCKERHSPAP